MMLKSPSLRRRSYESSDLFPLRIASSVAQTNLNTTILSLFLPHSGKTALMPHKNCTRALRVLTDGALAPYITYSYPPFSLLPSSTTLQPRKLNIIPVLKHDKLFLSPPFSSLPSSTSTTSTSFLGAGYHHQACNQIELITVS